MSRDLQIQIADPAGNRTVIVETLVPKSQRAYVSACLMNLTFLRAEQIAFAAKPLHGGDGRLEMLTGRFSGNAARSYGCILCRQKKTDRCRIEMTGANGLFEVRADWTEGRSEIDMPVPREIRAGTLGYESFPLIPGRGKVIMLAENMDVDRDLIERAVEKWGDAFAIMEILFLKGNHLIPVVCGGTSHRRIYPSASAEGSLAAHWYLTLDEGNGIFEREFQMPGGAVTARIRREEGRTEGTIGGSVRIYDPQTIEIPEHGNVRLDRDSLFTPKG